jgi:THO complex subunit 6
MSASVPHALPAPPSVNASTFSPDGSYLVCGTSLGRLHVWHFGDEEGAKTGDEGSMPMPKRLLTMRAHGCAVYALTFAETSRGLLLLSGADEEICGWRWDAILGCGTGKPPEAVLRFENPRTALRRGAVGQLSETSALAVDAGAGRLYSAAGDGNAYVWDLSTSACVGTFAGVGEPLHCLTLCPRRQQLVTGGEDGGVRLWDVRTAACQQVLTPTTPPLVPADLRAVGKGGAAVGAGVGGSGGWCGCVAVDEAENWLVAGWGDGFLCSIDLNTYAAVACMPTAAPPLAARFEPSSDFHFVSVGAESGLYRWRLTGELETRATCSSPSALGLAASARPGGAKAIAVGGSAGTVDVFEDTSHRAFTLCLPEE